MSSNPRNIFLSDLRNIQLETISRGSWADLKYVSFEGTASRPDVAAIAAVGVLGLGARRESTLISVGYKDGTVHFLEMSALFAFRGIVSDLSERSPEAREKLILGPPPDSVIIDSKSLGELSHEEEDIISKLERAAELLDRGLLDRAEFDDLKRSLLGDIADWSGPANQSAQ